MHILKAAAVAFSIYSRIPMPKFDWKEEDTRHSIVFFPFVGAVIGIVYFAVIYFGKKLGIPEIALALLATAVPLIISGGFHVDGYMDTKDALNSFKPREEKLKILKDPHTGAFAIIWLGILGLCFVAMQVIMLSGEDILRFAGVAACSFFFARCLSGLFVIVLKPAKNDGMMQQESKEALRAKNANTIILVIEMVTILVVMVFTDYFAATVAVIVAVFWCLIYINRCKRIFGGTTGDTAGYFLVKCELYMAVAVAACHVISAHVNF